MSNDKTEKQVIDLTPTWKEQLKVIRLILESNMDNDKKEIAWKELERMAGIADLYVVIAKESESKNLTLETLNRIGKTGKQLW